MINIETYRRQHEEILGIAAMILKPLEAPGLGQDAHQVHSLLSQLAGKLSVHLAMEDESLYPKLLEHSDEEVRSMARDYLSEMGDLAKTFKSYMDTWNTVEAIKDDPDEFVSRTNQLFSALANRITREDKELYRLVEATDLFK